MNVAVIFFSSRKRTLALVFFLCAVALFLFLTQIASARYIAGYKDTISTSVPSQFANHTIEFTLNTDVPPGGYISITPEDGAFSIPTSTFSFLDTDLFVSTGGPYTLRSATTTPDATYDGINVTSGTSGEIRFTLNSTSGISSGSNIRIVLGNQATYASTTFDTGIQNPSVIGTRKISIEAGGGAETASANALIAIVDAVGVLTKTEKHPPIRFNGAPMGLLSGTVSGVQISLETDEQATCRFSSASNTPYASMSLGFSFTTSVLHTTNVTGLSPNTSYTYYVRCIDNDQGKANTDDYPITFTIPDVPTGTPGTGSSTSSHGEGTGTGTGSSGGGAGSSAGGGGGSGQGGSGSGGGATSGAGSGGGAGGGGFESTIAQYRSGDAQVDITGYAFPNSTVTILVDGGVAVTSQANGTGEFSASVPAIARGVYTFGVYAVDNQNTRSSIFSTTFSVIGARTSLLSNINLMPTIRVTPNPVTPGGIVTFSGSAIANSAITIETTRDKTNGSPRTYQATSNNNGAWTIDVPTTGFESDTWKVRAKSNNATLNIATQFSGYTFYGIGGAVKSGLNSDLNRDGKVNLVDFSILLFHWGTDGGASNPPADINHDGKVNLTDFSIMIFNWTG